MHKEIVICDQCNKQISDDYDAFQSSIAYDIRIRDKTGSKHVFTGNVDMCSLACTRRFFEDIAGTANADIVKAYESVEVEKTEAEIAVISSICSDQEVTEV